MKLKLPSLHEIDDAVHAAAEDGPIPLSGIVDQHELLRATVDAAVDMIYRQTRYLLPSKSQPLRPFLEQAIKTGLVQGLNIGIRIGEARSKVKDAPH